MELSKMYFEMVNFEIDAEEELETEMFDFDKMIKTLNDNIYMCNICACDELICGTSCCKNKLCLTCKKKLGCCPFCRSVWDSEKDLKQKHDILNNISFSQPVHVDDMDPIDLSEPTYEDYWDFRGRLSDFEQNIVVAYESMIDMLTNEGFIYYHPRHGLYVRHEFTMTNAMMNFHDFFEDIFVAHLLNNYIDLHRRIVNEGVIVETNRFNPSITVKQCIQLMLNAKFEVDVDIEQFIRT